MSTSQPPEHDAHDVDVAALAEAADVVFAVDGPTLRNLVEPISGPTIAWTPSGLFYDLTLIEPYAARRYTVPREHPFGSRRVATTKRR